MPISMSRTKPTPENIAPLIFLLRGEKVLLGQHLAELYAVPVKVLNQSLKRNIDRFPEDFMFQLFQDELHIALRSRSQIVTLKRGQNRGGVKRYLSAHKHYHRFRLFFGRLICENVVLI